MTIQQDIRAKISKAYKIAISGWLLCFAGIVLGDNYALLFIPGFLIFGGAVLFVMFSICCPKCGARIGQTAFQSKKLKFCPECGIDFSEPTH